MYDAIMIKFGNYRFLLPERGFSFFPEAFEEHRPQIERMASAYERLIVSLDNPFSAEAEAASAAAKAVKVELAGFIAQTGVIGEPFDSKDAELYAATNGIRIQMEVTM